MPFQKGNKLGAKGRPKGSKNKATDVNKFQLQQTLYNMEEFINDFKSLSYGMQLGMAASTILPRAELFPRGVVIKQLGQ